LGRGPGRFPAQHRGGSRIFIRNNLPIFQRPSQLASRHQGRGHAAAVIAFERIAAKESDPELRVQKVFLGVARLLPMSLNWLSQVRTILALGCTTSAMKARIGYISPGLAG
jgi:hypothetical protein